MTNSIVDIDRNQISYLNNVYYREDGPVKPGMWETIKAIFTI